MKKLFVLSLITLSIPSFATECTSDIYSAQVQQEVKRAFDIALNRDESAYENPLSLVSYTHPKICEYREYSGMAQMTVSSQVTVDIYYEEGGVERATENCEVFLVKEDYFGNGPQWLANQVFCDNYLMVDEEI